MSAYAAALELLDAGGEIVTANSRQAQALTAAYGRAALAAGRAAWPAPRLLSWSAWLERQLLRFDERPRLLGPEASLRLWQQIVAASPAGAELISARAAAAGAAHAWQLAHDWQLDLEAEAPTTPEQAAFTGWARDFVAATRALGAIDLARLPRLLAGRAAALAAELTAEGVTALGWHGRVRETPAQAALGAALAAAGLGSQRLAVAAGPATLAACAAANPAAELEALAAWLLVRLGAQPQARLGVIVPELAGCRAALARLLDERLQPALLAPGAPDVRPYAFASGRTLGAHAVVAAACDALALGRETLDVLAVGQLLRSPYFPASADELQQQARLDAELREQGGRTLAGAGLARRIASANVPCATFAARIAALRAELEGPARRDAGDWASAMQRALRAAGWPKGRALGAAEYAAATELNAAFASFGALAAVLPRLDYAAALAELESILGAWPFELPLAEPQLLVLERLEDPGLAFDGLWVAGLTADRLPAAAQPNPFLPLELQRTRALPGASPAVALAEARQALGDWQRSTAELVLSWPLRDGDTELARATLLPALPPLALPQLPAARARELQRAGGLVGWRDDSPPALPPGTLLVGGARTLTLQSRCPFRAAAEQRLGARRLAAPVAGVPPAMRGLLMHAALARFWGGIVTQAELLARGEDGRRRAASAAVAAAIAEYAPRLPRTRLLELERAWLERALVALARAELARPPFSVVECEAAQLLELGDWQLRTRIDRRDRLADGTTVLLDYKTGRGLPRRWAGPRPDEMQLPLYAACAAPTPLAVAYARLPLALTGFAGLAAVDGLLPGVRALAAVRSAELRGHDWQALIGEWRATAVRLAAEHAAGAAAVDPLPDACEHCALAALCRIAERPVGEDDP